MGHAETLLEILAREERKKEITRRARQSLDPLIQQTLLLLEQAEQAYQEAQRAIAPVSQQAEESDSKPLQ